METRMHVGVAVAFLDGGVGAIEIVTDSYSGAGAGCNAGGA
jgi:hypothetical protein